MIGDFTPGKTVRKMFNTQKADGTPITLAGTPAISVYKDGGTTESTAGVTLNVDRDSRTGMHLVTIDTSADGTFYSAGSDFEIVITTGTVDSISVVGAVVETFSLSNRSALRPTTADRTLDVSSGGEAGVDWANVGSPTTTVTLSGTTVKTATDVETDTADIQTRLPAALVSGRMASDVIALSGDTAAADNAEAFFDGTGYAGTNNVIPTVTTVGTTTNVTNAPSSGDFTATMKTSIGTAVAASAVASVTGNVGGNVTGSVGSVVGAVGSVTGNVGGNVAGTVASVVGAVGSVTGNVGGNVAGSVGSVTAGVTLADDAITAAKFDESTAFPLKSADASTTAIARVGADGDTLETLSDQLDGIHSKTTNLPSDPADQSILAGRFDDVDDAIAGIDGGGGGGSGGSVEVITQAVPVGEHYVQTGDSLAAFKFETYELVEGARVLHTYDDMELALYIDGTLSGTVPVATELSEGVFQFASSPVLPAITARQRLRIEASSDDAGVDGEAVWFGVVPAESTLAQVVFTSTEDADTAGANVTWYTNETAKTKTVICLNAAGDPIDLDTDYDLTDAYLVIERAGPPRTDVQVIEIADITIGGTDDNELTFQADATVLAKKGDFIWAFRQADKSVIASGRITVIYAADVDP